MHGLCFMICLLVARAAVASHKCHSRVRHFGRVFVLPYRSSPLCGLKLRLSGVFSVHVVVAGVEHVFVKEIRVFDGSKCKIFLASQGRRLTAGAARFWPYDTFFRHLLGFRV